ncbi:MAG TPA: hypothetical protein VGC42_29010 [Kofleriaceae bacterium]
MQNHNAHATNLPDAEPTAPGEPPRRWQAEVIELLQHAAALCSEHNIDADAFMSKAWSAYIESRPGLRDQLEEAHLAAQLDELRKLGRMGEA